jgi:hypothetical protein
MSKNIKSYLEEKRRKIHYMLVSSNDISPPNYSFETNEEAEIALSIIKYMNKNKLDNNYSQAIKYAFRAIGIDSAWSK